MVEVTFACEPYDRIVPLLTGAVSVKGVRLIYLEQLVEETFWRQLRHREYDVSELSLSSYLISRDRGVTDLVAIPVFPSRAFRHNTIFVHRDAAIAAPQDLKGKRVGVPEYEITAALWIRGILEDEYGVRPEEIEWWTGGQEQPGRQEKLPIAPPGVTIRRLPEDATLSQWLLEARLDAFIGAHTPSAFRHPSGVVRRLFPDPAAVEREYFARTGIYPIMHTVVIQTRLLDRYPWIARNLYEAFVEAKQVALARLKQTATSMAALPWLYQAVEEAQAVLGEDLWPYGLAANRKTLETAIRYARRQGLVSNDLRLEELFAPSTVDRGYAI